MIGPIGTPTDLLVRLFHEEGPRVFRRPAGALWLFLLGRQGAQHHVDLFSQKDIAR
jgi:hypothetical protein